MQLNKHWKEYTNPDYIGAYSFLTEEENGRVVSQAQYVEFTKVEQKEITGEGGKKAIKIVASIKGNKKQMVFNATNAKKMIELFGDSCMFPENWVGKTVIINAVKILERGAMEWRMRITAKQENASKPAFTPNHKKWNGAKKAIKAGTANIQQIEKSYFISPEHKKLLLNG